MTLELGKKKYSIDCVPVRALAEMDEVWDIYRKLMKAAAGQDAGDISFQQAVEPLAKWLVILFNNQFTVKEVLDNYPADRFIVDVGLMLQAVVGRVTDALTTFPTKARPMGTNQKNPIATLLSKFMPRTWKRDEPRTKSEDTTPSQS